MSFPVYDTMRHLAHQDQSKIYPGLIIGSGNRRRTNDALGWMFVTNTIVDLNIFYRGRRTCVYPLYVDTEVKLSTRETQKFQELGDEKETIISGISNGTSSRETTDCLGEEPPKDLFDYIYAILHFSNYRDKFKNN